MVDAGDVPGVSRSDYMVLSAGIPLLTLSNSY